jgi:hypothetical protein
MSTTERTARRRKTEQALEPWQAGVVGGILGGLLFGIIMSVQTPEVLETAIPAGLYGLPENGLVVWATLAAVVMPIWVSGGSLAGVPNFATESIVGHAVYGTTLGLAYSVLTE